jgi:hypothetical protein
MNFKTLLIKIFITHPGVFVPGCNFYKSHSLKNHNKGFSFSPAYRESRKSDIEGKTRMGTAGKCDSKFFIYSNLKSKLV